MYVYPLKQEGLLKTLDKLALPERQQHLLSHLRANKLLRALEEYDTEVLEINPDDLLEQMQKGDGPWKDKVPEAVYQTIKQKRLFGYSSI